MLTRMTEEDWALALEVFDVAQSSLERASTHRPGIAS
jgi:hypothetical protein